MAAITLEELLKEVGVCPEKLNESISDDHLREIALFLTSWQTVASHLDLSENDLDDAEQGGRKVKDKSLKALQIWKGKFGFKATYKKLMEVLLSLAMADVAEKVCHLLKESIPVHKNVTRVLQLQSNSREHEASDARSASDVNTGLTDVLSKRPEFQQLSTSEQEELMVTLYDDEKSMRRQFGKLVVKTCDSVEERIPVVKFARSILALGAYDPAPGERDPALLDEHSEEIKRAGSISEIFNILSTYWNYLNYEILEDIIELYGKSDDAERLRNYNKELYKFCKRRIFELPPESSSGNTLSPKQERFLVKLNIRKDITYEQLLQIRGRIAKILKIRVATLVLSRVDEGCVQLTFLIARFVAQDIFPLSYAQTSALSKDVSVIRLECGQYIFEFTSEMYNEDSVAQNMMKLGLEEESQPPKKTCAKRRQRTAQSNTEYQKDYYNASSVVRNMTAVRHLDQVPLITKKTWSISLPSLHAFETKARYSPPPSPPKARSRSVRLNIKKIFSFKKLKKLFGSHVELDNRGGLWWTDDHQTVGTYRPLTYARPRSIGVSSDCSSSSYTHSDFSRCNSLRDSSHSRISHGNDSVFGVRQASYDSADYVPTHHILAGSSDSNLRPFSIAYMPRSLSNTLLKNPRHFSIAAIPANSTSVDPPADSLQSRKHSPLQLMHRTQVMPDDMESVWEDSHSFTYVPNAPVVPSDPGYLQLAEECMSALPTRKNSTDFQDSRMISDPTLDPRRISTDSGVESSSTKPNHLLPSTPNTQSFISVRDEGASTPELRLGTSRDFLSHESLHSLPPRWDMAYTPQGHRYYIDHNLQTTHWRLPNDTDDSLELPTGWEVIRSTRYGTYYVNHNNKTAIYQHPFHARAPPPYRHSLQFKEEEPKRARERKTPARSHSHRSTPTRRVLEPNVSLPGRSKSFQDQEMQDGYPARVSNERQLSTMTYVTPSPYQIAEIPPWLQEYIDTPFGCKKDTEIQWHRYSHEDLTGLDTMVKRLLKKGSEEIVKQYEYYRVAVQQEIDIRIRQRHRAAMQKTIQRQLSQQYRPPPLLLPTYQEPSLDGGRYGPFHKKPRVSQLQLRLSDSDFLQELEETYV